jgi:signal transduction histidine kinase
VSAVAFSGAERTDVQAMLDAVLAISSDLDLHTVLNTIVESCCAVTGARLGFLGVLGEDGELVDQVAHGLTDEEVAHLLAPATGRSLVGHLVRHPYPIRLTSSERAAYVGDLPGRPGSPGQLDSLLCVPLRVGQKVFGTLCLSRKSSGEFTLDDEQTVDALARVAGVAVGNARAYALSERRREWVEAAAQIAETLHPPFRIEDTLRQIVVGLRRVVRGSVAAVVHGRDGGYDVPALDGPRYAGLSQVLEEHTAELAHAQETGELVIRSHSPGGTLVCAPLSADLAYPGVLVVLVERGHGSLSDVDRELLTAYAAQASLALDRADALLTREDAAVVADRDRIARDLHDLVIQRLFATGLQLQGARRITNPQDLHARLDTAVADLDQTIRDIRNTIFELEHGRDDTLRNNVASLVREYEPALGFAPTVRTTGAVDSLVDRALGEHVLATLREALSNVARHAEAEAARVELHVDPEELLLIVADDGRGLSGQVRESGLRNLRRRAEEVGGSMRIGEVPTGGTRLEWRVPVS